MSGVFVCWLRFEVVDWVFSEEMQVVSKILEIYLCER